ncbi:hypothetical protein IFM89_001375 [Coptis chinensis]|uniref:PB1 domain-containing protein n=1 Tax=Coptis chinensis TaxID=261450 RepID=A0A835LL52_9MAGN|nr:hypothetical protein IFM89_001375 [Coptis chinensis]
MDLTRVTTRQLIAKYGLDDNTVDFIGHLVALHRDDCYLDEPALDTMMRMKLLCENQSIAFKEDHRKLPMQEKLSVILLTCPISRHARKSRFLENEDCPVKMKLVAPPLYALTTQTLDKNYLKRKVVRDGGHARSTVKATYRDDTVRFKFEPCTGCVHLFEEVGKRFKLPTGTFQLQFLDDEKEWVMLASDLDLQECLEVLESIGSPWEALSSLCALGNLTVETRTKYEPMATHLTFDHTVKGKQHARLVPQLLLREIYVSDVVERDTSRKTAPKKKDGVKVSQSEKTVTGGETGSAPAIEGARINSG